jgi:hypothetical protein
MNDTLADLQSKLANLEAEKAHIVRQYDTNLDCALRISAKLEKAREALEGIAWIAGSTPNQGSLDAIRKRARTALEETK